MKIRYTGLFLAALIMMSVMGADVAFGQDAPAPAPAPAPATPPGVVPAPAGTLGCKVGFVNLVRVLDESKEGQRVRKAMEAEREKSLAPIKAKQDQLGKIEAQINTLTQEIVTKGQVWDDGTKLAKRNELQGLQMQYNNILDEIQLDKNRISQDLNKKNSEMLKPLEDKLNKVMQGIGEKGGYCLVLDVSPPSSNMPSFNPIIYRDPSLDITDQVIQAVDK